MCELVLFLWSLQYSDKHWVRNIYQLVKLLFPSLPDEKVTIFDKTEVNLVAFRRTIYLAIQSRYTHTTSYFFNSWALNIFLQILFTWIHVNSTTEYKDKANFFFFFFFYENKVIILHKYCSHDKTRIVIWEQSQNNTRINQ